MIEQRGLAVVGLVAIGLAAFLYNKQLDLEASRQRLAQEQQSHQRQIECAEAGKKFATEYLRQEASALQPHERSVWDDPEYHYSDELRTCIVRTRFVTLAGLVTYQHARITDVNSNKAVLESYVTLLPDPDPSKPGGSLKEELSDIIEGPNLSRDVFQSRADAIMKR